MISDQADKNQGTLEYAPNTKIFQNYNWFIASGMKCLLTGAQLLEIRRHCKFEDDTIRPIRPAQLAEFPRSEFDPELFSLRAYVKFFCDTRPKPAQTGSLGQDTVLWCSQPTKLWKPNKNHDKP